MRPAERKRTFFPAIWRSLKLDSITCELEFLPLVHTKAEDNRAEVAGYLHQIISQKFIPFKPGMNESYVASAADMTPRTELATKS